MKLYHGSNCKFDFIDLAKSKNKRDFGKGFYLTTSRNQAEDWAYKMYARYEGEGAFLYEFEWNEDIITLSYKIYEKASIEWLLMIKKNRKDGHLQHDFDVVKGKVADDDIARTISAYIDDTYTEEETITRLKTDKLQDQVSFHTEKAIKTLTLLNRIELNGNEIYL
ncbi:MAG: DUF3990 domain-containing protein [Flavobacteriaceae bacterium]